MDFDAHWLALRESADHAARDMSLLERAARLAGPTPLVLDLACGTGSTMRALSEHLPERARWRLVDRDPILLQLAQDWNPSAVETRLCDISDPENLPLNDVSLVTASALLDLVSNRWLDALVTLLAAARLPFYAALTYDGRMNWDPVLPEDASVASAFNRHQLSDKGFGPALGPRAADRAAELFEQRGYNVSVAPSDWCLTAANVDLKKAVTNDIVSAACEAGYGAPRAWHLESTGRPLRIGHLDLLAVPSAIGVT